MRDLTIRDVAERLGKNKATIRRWAERGAFPGARKIGRPWLIPEEDVERVKREGFPIEDLERETA